MDRRLLGWFALLVMWLFLTLCGCVCAAPEPTPSPTFTREPARVPTSTPTSAPSPTATPTPTPEATQAPTPTSPYGVNLLVNPGFEGIGIPVDNDGPVSENWSRDTFDGQEYGAIFTPDGWVTWWRTEDDYGQPDVHLFPVGRGSSDAPPRILEGYYAVRMFTFWRRHDMGLYQVVTDLEPGSTIEFSAHAHGWSCDSSATMGYSCGDLENQTFQIGIEPNGLTDPFALTVVWSEEQTSPDQYSLIGPVTAEVGAGGSVCVFVRSKTKQSYRHQDAFWDRAQLIMLPPD